MSTTTDKPAIESDDVHTIRCRNVVRHGAIDDATTDNSAFGTAAMKKAADDVDFLLAELDQIEAKHESQLDDACEELGEIRGCEKCDLCEDHHG